MFPTPQIYKKFESPSLNPIHPGLSNNTKSTPKLPYKL
jgi:hypothetical protein